MTRRRQELGHRAAHRAAQHAHRKGNFGACVCVAVEQCTYERHVWLVDARVYSAVRLRRDCCLHKGLRIVRCRGL
eukprot:4077551-Pleurochrysis_carterae.AAC.5